MPKIISKKGITLDDLAAMCMREFTFIHEKMTKMDEKIQNIESTMATTMATKRDLSELESRMDKRFDRIETIITDHTFRIEHLERIAEAD